MPNVRSNPAVDLSDLTEAWPSMSPSARRHAMSARMLGTDRGLLAWMARRLGIAWKPSPPSARRAQARALVLAALVARARLESEGHVDGKPLMRGDGGLVFLKKLKVAGELEPQERSFLRSRVGLADKVVAANASWRVEGWGVLAWALGRYDLPAYDEPVTFRDVEASIGAFNDEVARSMLDSAAFRPTGEIDAFATLATLVNWRLRTFRLAPGPWDFIGHLRKHASFHEGWMKGLRFIDGDLAIGSVPILAASPEAVERCERMAVERQVAAYWLQGDDRLYSRVNPSTLISAC